MTAAYLDASAVVKLFKAEAESRALVRELRSRAAWLSSELVAVEARCTARRLGGAGMLTGAEQALSNIELIGLTRSIRDRAGRPFELPLRALDALHAATVLALGDRIGAVFAYDSDLSRAIAAEGFDVIAPGQP